MLSRNTYITITTKFLILLINFGLVIFTTQIWGSEGRGEIAMVIADISIITIFSNIFCGSTIAYHAPKLNRNLLLTIAQIGAILVSLSGAIVFSYITGFDYFLPLLLISLLLSLTVAIMSYLLGKNKISNYNLLGLAGPLSIGIALLFLYFILKKTSVSTYFSAYYLGTGLILIIAMIGLINKEPFTWPGLNFIEIKNVLSYGVTNEINSFLQFLNYRISYYFIIKMLGLSQLGVFSIAVSVSEAFWVISRSLSAIHFSNVINSKNPEKNRDETIRYVKQSFWISLVLISISVIIPGDVYRFIFGHDFANTRTLIIYLIPGIIAIAVSNIYDQYFSGTGRLKVLTIKYSIGLILTLCLLPFLIARMGLKGVCIAIDISYIISSVFIWYMFTKSGHSAKLKKTESPGY
jgi:O-antigen/teichoic acid export membrane protein